MQRLIGKCIGTGCRWFAITAIAIASGTASAQTFPSKSLQIVVPYNPGGAVDTVARIVGPQLAKQLGQNVLIVNKPGASGNIGAELVVRSPADGYTMLLGANPLASSPSLKKHLPYDPLKDLATVARVGYAPLVLVVPTASPVKTVHDLIALAKAKAGAMNYGSAGVGGSGHLATELLKHVTGMEATHVPYSGGSPAMVDLVGGRLDFMIINPLEAAPRVAAGKLRAIAVSSKQRLALLPNVPTFEESGVKNYEASVWWGFLVPAATPKAVVNKLSTEILEALKDPTVKKKLIAQGAVVEPLDAAGFHKFLAAETAKWADVIHMAGIPPN
jgi:tripartite-type tricarboxylate transporter receptor subunit TctC